MSRVVITPELRFRGDDSDGPSAEIRQPIFEPASRARIRGSRREPIARISASGGKTLRPGAASRKLSFNHRNIVYAKLLDKLQLPANVSTCDTGAARSVQCRRGTSLHCTRGRRKCLFGAQPEKPCARARVGWAGGISLRTQPIRTGFTRAMMTRSISIRFGSHFRKHRLPAGGRRSPSHEAIYSASRPRPERMKSNGPNVARLLRHTPIVEGSGVDTRLCR